LETTTTPVRRHDKTADDTVARSAAKTKASTPPPRFKTVLVPMCGWPTEGSVRPPRKRSAKR
jgi:hypothetical protein